MAFSDALTNDIARALNTEEAAIEIIYETTSIDVMIEYGRSGRNDLNEDFRADKAIIELKVPDVTEPQYRDQITIEATWSRSGSEETWYVQRPIEGDKGTWIVGIEKDHRPELL